MNYTREQKDACLKLIELYDIFTDPDGLGNHRIDEKACFHYKYFQAFELISQITKRDQKNLLESIKQAYLNLKIFSQSARHPIYSIIEVNRKEVDNFVELLFVFFTNGLSIDKYSFLGFINEYNERKLKGGGVAFVMLDNISFGRKLEVFNQGTCEALNSAFMSFFMGWKGKNFSQILYKIFFIWVVLITFMFYVISLTFYYLGKLIYIFPLLNVVIACINYLVFLLGSGFALLGNLHARKEFLSDLNEDYKKGIIDALHCIPY